MRVQIITNPDKSNTYSEYYKMPTREQSNVTTSLSPINKADAQLEAEKGELVVPEDLSTIHKILGKPHSLGGTPLNLPNNSFIFSKDKSLAISPKEQKLFGFKIGGSVKKEDNSPARVLLRQIDIKHHNQMNAILNDKSNRDIVSKNTATIMMQKNKEKIGQIAYLQEAKKDFKTGVPAFSEGTQPIYSQDVKDKIVTENQYMKQGGMLKKYAPGGITYPPDNGKLEKFRGKQIDYGNLQKLNPFLENVNRYNQNVNVGPVLPSINNITDYQNDLVNTHPELVLDAFKNNSATFGANNEAYTEKLRQKYNIPKGYNQQQVLDYMYQQPESTYNNFILDQFKDGQWGQRAINRSKVNLKDKEEFDKIVNGRIPITTTKGQTFYQDPNDKKNYIEYTYGNTATAPITSAAAPKNPVNNAINQNTEPKIRGQYTNQKVPFNTGQIASLVGTSVINGMRKNIYPTRTENTFIPLELEKVNANTALQDNTNNWLQGARIAATMGTTPSQSNAFLQKAVIEGLSNGNKIRDQYDTQNVQIANNQNQYNNQEFNKVRAKNVNNNEKYVTKSDLLKGRINEEKINSATDFLNKGLGYYGQNLQMQNALQAMKQYPVLNPDGTPKIDPRTGKQIYNTAYSTDFNGNFKFNNVNGLNDILTGNTRTDAVSTRIAILEKKLENEKDPELVDSINRQITALTLKLFPKKYGGYIKRK